MVFSYVFPVLTPLLKMARPNVLFDLSMTFSAHCFSKLLFHRVFGLKLFALLLFFSIFGLQKHVLYTHRFNPFFFLILTILLYVSLVVFVFPILLPLLPIN
jgi:hypothetical protein